MFPLVSIILVVPTKNEPPVTGLVVLTEFDKIAVPKALVIAPEVSDAGAGRNCEFITPVLDINATGGALAPVATIIVFGAFLYVIDAPVPNVTV